MIRIKWGPIRCAFPDPLPGELSSSIDRLLSYKSPGYRFNKQYKAGIWDGQKHLFWPKRRKFPTGFLADVVEFLQTDRGLKVVIDSPIKLLPVALVTELADGTKLRPYQIEACEAYLNSGLGRGVLRVPTAGGKTAILAAITGSMQMQTLGLIHGNTLLNQTYEDFQKLLGEDQVGLIGSGEFDIRRFTLSSVDTIFARLKSGDENVGAFLANVGFVWCDEVHRASAMSWVKILKAIKTPFRMGVSGTPLKGSDASDMELQAWTGPLLYDIQPATLQEQGYISHATLSLLEVNTPQGGGSFKWHDVVKEFIIDNEPRNQRIADLAIERAEKGKAVFLLAGNSIPLARWYYRYIEEVFPGVELVTGQSGVSSNKEALRRFKEGASRIVVATTVLDEGINAPDTSVVILANTGKSYVKVMQRIGRGLRLKQEAGQMLEVVDVIDNTHNFLKKHSQIRLGYYEDEAMFSSVGFV